MHFRAFGTQPSFENSSIAELTYTISTFFRW